MNFLFILPQIEKAGGQSIQALNLAKNLNKNNNKIYVLKFKSKPPEGELSRSSSKFPIFSYKIILNYSTVLIAPFLVTKSFSSLNYC